MLSRPVGAPSASLSPVRLRDVPRVAATLGRAFAPARSRVLGVAAWPVWVVLLVLQGGWVHDGADVVARVVRRGPWLQITSAARAVLLAVVAGGTVGVFLGALGVLVELGDPLSALVVAVLTWPVAAILVVTVETVRVNVRVLRVIASASRGASVAERQDDVRSFRSAEWLVSSAASPDAAGGLVLVAEHVRDLAAPGEAVAAVAASPELARLYTRFGLRPLPSRPLLLVGRVTADVAADITADYGATPTRGVKPSHHVVPHREIG
ncbi:hypothetical protein ATJ88_3137 [Isoptericola jiangsuensis]|uniref:Uncharacterized protein n=1 Tax=Isoptericola jiangsuensis TaxID=548579 RepID=A0A2A9F0A3_9MICO|nr:hypothetical protein [Isoptericola jiangsuensis]PFG44413.1 hypothetical protein ATJ88_3137 [Isoptericola jiangsuensis]